MRHIFVWRSTVFLRLSLALFILFATIPSVGAAESLEDVAKEAEHMTEDVAKAKTAPAGAARALAKEIADHAEEAEEALEVAGPKAGAAARAAIESAVVRARAVTAAALAVQRAADSDVRARVADLDTAIQAFVPALRTAVAATRPATLPRTGGVSEAALLAIVLGSAALVLSGRRLASKEG
ncbi:MAG: hypothetical protein FJ033_16915 [Chloroflexi bacterium]|nr:hypothetical protein [Chloroflexota bacterium]